MNNYPTGVIMDAVLEEEVEVVDEDKWEDRLDEDEAYDRWDHDVPTLSDTITDRNDE